MLFSSSLQAPLSGRIHADQSFRGRPAIVLVGAALSIAVFSFLWIDRFRAAGRVSRPGEASVLQAPRLVTDVLRLYARPMSVEQINDLLERLPAHDVEDVVFEHIKPYVELVFYSFLQYYGTTAPQFKTGQKLKRRHKMEDDHEFRYRLAVFEDSVRDAIRLNNFEAHHSMRSDRAVFGVTKFADWTFEEFKTLLKGPATKVNTTAYSKTSRVERRLRSNTRSTPPCTKNWAEEYPGLFQARDQGRCGSCYSFAAADDIRVMGFLNTGVDQGELSIQYTLDCKGGEGCVGGDAGDVMNWIAQQGGIPRKADYGVYRGKVDTCKEDIPKALTTTGAERFYDEDAIAHKLCQDGPLSMGVYASDAFQHYRSGVMSDHSCHSSFTNHDAQVVGVLEDKGAFLLKSSWGRDWGINATTLKPSREDAGFILLEFGQNTCDLTDCSSFAKGVSCVGNCSDLPTTPPPPLDSVCSNTCKSANDGRCDDGGKDSDTNYCAYGMDCDDCGFRPPLPKPKPVPPGYLCDNTCRWKNDNECDDGGPDSNDKYCRYGTDCDDCGARQPLPTTTTTSPPAGYLCSNMCQYSGDGDCDDGGADSVDGFCAYGTDCDDCGSRPPAAQAVQQ